jgi:hypothetical protein
MVEPIDVFQDGDLDLLERSPGRAGLDQFGLEQPDDRLRKRVVVGVADGSD